MTVQYFLPDGSEIIFQRIARRKYRGLLLPGSNVRSRNLESMIITLQEYEHPFFAISHRLLELFDKVRLSVTERPGLRLEALLKGDLGITANNKKVRLKAGHYHLTDVPFFTVLFRKNTSCSIFITYYSIELLDQLGIEPVPTKPLKIPNEMSILIQELLRSPYEDKLRSFHYENSVRELLFFHLAQGKDSVSKELDDGDIAAIYRADEIIASNLGEHFSIEKLSRMTGTNRLKLKKGFRQVFGMGVFGRLLFRRMEQAKSLLASTNKSIGEVAQLAGYDTVAGFIHAFRREFGVTPREWRNQSRKSNEE